DPAAARRARAGRTGRGLVQCGGHGVSPWSPVDPSTSGAWARRITMRHRDRYAPHSVRSPNGHSTWADARLGPVRRHSILSAARGSGHTARNDIEPTRAGATGL